MAASAPSAPTAAATADDDKLIVYQLLPRLFTNSSTTNKPWGTPQENGVGKFEQITDKALAEMKALGITHMWYTGIIEHATMTAYPGLPADDADVVKGRAGSPYAIRDYYDVDPDLATSPDKRMQEWEALIKRTHKAGMKVVMDFIPNHVARSYHSDAKPAGVVDLGEKDDRTKTFASNNNFYYLPGQAFVVPKQSNPLGEAIAPGEDGKYAENPAKATGNDVFSAAPSLNDWFETCKLNYGWDYQGGQKIPHFDPVPDTWVKMRDILIYWAAKDVDAFRCDVAEMVPVEFWAWCIPEVKRARPQVKFIAEIYNPAAYHRYVEVRKFDYLYDKVGLYDRLRELMAGGGSTGKLDFIWQTESRGIERNMYRFLENHDEQRIASPQFSGNPRTAIPGMTVTALLNKGPVMLYFGQEVGEPGTDAEGFSSADGRTSIFDYWGVPQHQKWLNGGKFDGGKLAPEQKELRAFYGKLLNLCHQPVIRAGEFYGLHFAQEHGQAAGYDDQRCYAFLRYTATDRLLVVVNFDRDKAHDATLKIPEAALKTLGLPTTGQLRFTDQLLTSRELAVAAADLFAPASTRGLKVGLPPLSAAVFRIAAK
ncbi:MAG: alpha-amylase family protein [Hymenobacteraceae bacterium]|nr:alpha-amylase family protein [Hymenobacteraceae bacterium]